MSTNNSTFILYKSVMYILNKVNLSFENMFPLCNNLEILCEEGVIGLQQIDKRYDYRELEFFVYSLLQQLQYLENNHYTLYSLEPKYCYELTKTDLNGNKILIAFVYSLLTPNELSIISGNNNYESDLCNEFIGFFNEEGYVKRYLPLIQKTKWMDPTISLQTTLPFLYHYKTLYYSISMILLELISEDTFKKIKGTKLRQFIKHCRIGIPSKRIIFL